MTRVRQQQQQQQSGKCGFVFGADLVCSFVAFPLAQDHTRSLSLILHLLHIISCPLSPIPIRFNPRSISSAHFDLSLIMLKRPPLSSSR